MVPIIPWMDDKQLKFLALNRKDSLEKFESTKACGDTINICQCREIHKKKFLALS